MSRAGVEPAPYDLQSYALPSSPRDAKATFVDSPPGSQSWGPPGSSLARQPIESPGASLRLEKPKTQTIAWNSGQHYRVILRRGIYY